MSKFVIGFVLQIIAIILHIVGFASPYWIYAEQVGQKGYEGLWKACTTKTTIHVTTCVDTTPSALDWFKAVQAFACLGLIFLFIAVVLSAFKLRKNRTSLIYLSALSTFMGAICILISISVYAAKMSDVGASGHFHFAFAFCIIAMVLSIPAGILMLVVASN